MIRAFTRSLSLLVCLSLPVHAAEPRPPEVLAAEDARARSLAEGGKIDEAVTIWLDILDEVSPKGRGDVHVNLAVAYRAMERLPEAWFHLDAYLTDAAEDDAAVAEERAVVEKQLVKTHVPLRFSCEVPGTALFFTSDRAQAYPCPLRWWFPRGTAGILYAFADDHEPGEVPIRAHELDRDRRVIVRLEPSPPSELPEKPVPVPLVVKKRPKPRKGQAWKWSLLGGGVGLVAVGAVLQVMAFNKDQDLKKKWDPTDAADKAGFDLLAGKYDKAFNADVKPLGYGAYAMYGIGGAAAATGLAFLIMDWTRGDAGSAVHIAPLAAPGGTGLVLNLGF